MKRFLLSILGLALVAANPVKDLKFQGDATFAPGATIDYNNATVLHPPWTTGGGGGPPGTGLPDQAGHTGQWMKTDGFTAAWTPLPAFALDNAVVHSSGGEIIFGTKFFDVAPVVPTNSFAESKVTNLLTDLAGRVPVSRTVNNKALTGNIALTSQDVSAQDASIQLITNSIFGAWSNKTKLVRTVALANSAPLSLPRANAFVAGTTITYTDYLTDPTLPFGENLTPQGGDTLNGSVNPILAAIGGGTVELINDGVSAWVLLHNHSFILNLQDATNPAKQGHFNLSDITAPNDREIRLLDSAMSFVPPGGTTGQVLAKLDNSDFHYGWANQIGGGGGGSGIPVDGSVTNAKVAADAAITWDKISKTGAVESEILGTASDRGATLTIHFSIRADGHTGTGTSTDPFDATGDKLDKKLREYYLAGRTNLKVVLESGAFTSAPNTGLGDDLSRYWYPLTGWDIGGSGQFDTTVKYTNAYINGSGQAYALASWGTPYNETYDYVKIHDLTFDCNYPGLANQLRDRSSPIRTITTTAIGASNGTITATGGAFTVLDLRRRITGTGIPANSWIGAVTDGTHIIVSSSPVSNVPVSVSGVGNGATLSITTKDAALTALALKGSHMSVERVRAINSFGAVQENFVFIMAAGPLIDAIDDHIRYCLVEQAWGEYANPFALFGFGPQASGSYPNAHSWLGESSVEHCTAIGRAGPIGFSIPGNASPFASGGVNMARVRNIKIESNVFLEMGGPGVAYLDTDDYDGIEIVNNLCTNASEGVAFHTNGANTTDWDTGDQNRGRNLRIIRNTFGIQRRTIGGANYGIIVDGATTVPGVVIDQNIITYDTTGPGNDVFWGITTSAQVDGQVTNNTLDRDEHNAVGNVADNATPLSGIRVENNRMQSGAEITGLKDNTIQGFTLSANQSIRRKADNSGYEGFTPSGTGDVTGPGSATSGHLTTFSGSTGKVIQDSGVIFDTDTALTANSDGRLATQKATKAYSDAKTLANDPLWNAHGDIAFATASGSAVALAGNHTATPMYLLTKGNGSVVDNISYQQIHWGDLLYLSIQSTTLASNTNNWSPAPLGATALNMVAASTNVNLTGIAAQPGGYFTSIANVGASNAITLTDKDTNSSAANRMDFGGHSYVLQPGATVGMIYDSGNSIWRPSNTMAEDVGVMFTDNTTGNASTTAHGFLPKLDNNAAHFLNGQGGFTAPAAGGPIVTTYSSFSGSTSTSGAIALTGGKTNLKIYVTGRSATSTPNEVFVRFNADATSGHYTTAGYYNTFASSSSHTEWDSEAMSGGNAGRLGWLSVAAQPQSCITATLPSYTSSANKAYNAIFSFINATPHGSNGQAFGTYTSGAAITSVEVFDGFGTNIGASTVVTLVEE